jgi:isocitrate lyase
VDNRTARYPYHAKTSRRKLIRCYAFLVLAAEDGVIVALTGSMDAGFIRTIEVTCESDDLGNLYHSFHNVEEATLENMKNGGV